MIVGVPKEIKRDEYRVALLPVGAEELVRAGHTVLVETGAGIGSGDGAWCCPRTDCGPSVTSPSRPACVPPPWGT